MASKYVTVRLTEFEANALYAAAVAGQYEVSEVVQRDPDAKPGDAARHDAALDRAIKKLRNA